MRRKRRWVSLLLSLLLAMGLLAAPAAAEEKPYITQVAAGRSQQRRCVRLREQQFRPDRPFQPGRRLWMERRTDPHQDSHRREEGGGSSRSRVCEQWEYDG